MATSSGGWGTVLSWGLRLFVSAAVFLIGVHWGRSGSKPCSVVSAPSVEVVIDPCPDGVVATSAAAAASLSSLLGGHPSFECASSSSSSRDWLFLHKNDVSKLKDNSVLRKVFSQLHHPETPVKAELVLKQVSPASALAELVPSLPQQKVIPLPSSNPFGDCSSIYLTRSGSRESMPNKCVAVVNVPAHTASPSFHSHRYGMQAKHIDQYVSDWATEKEYTDESVLLPLFVSRLDAVVAEFVALMGGPIDPGTQARRSVFVMVANEGVMDLLLNFICSCQSAGISLANLVVFVGQKEYRVLIEKMGARAFYSPYLGSIPRKAADNYGDVVFARLMWLKATSVYIAAKAGFHVLFQDTDLVWLRDPVPYLLEHVTDIAFMDDGARTTRFTPFFVNSGFYYQKHSNKTRYLMEKMLKSAIEISATHSHQATLTRHLTEVHAFFGLDINVLPELLFPSGAQWHNNKKFVKQVVEYQLDSASEPFVWHLCWTSSRADKIVYLKELGMWYLPEKADEQCEVGSKMLEAAMRGEDLMKRCCLPGRYNFKKPKTAK